MVRVLLSGGSGFIAAHVLKQLLERGHSVVTTVRSQQKADKIKEAYPKLDKSQLDFAIVEDIAQEGAFEKAVVSDPPFEAVVHTASPFHFNATNNKRDFLDPALVGTTGILKSIKAHAPSVKRVVITSSFASIVDPFQENVNRPGHTYSEKDWNPITWDKGVNGDQACGYRASKKFAEKAAWDFVETEKPNFTVATICPPFVFGPVVHFLNSLDALNTSNQRISNFVLGKCKDQMPPTATFIWVDVRDCAAAHVRAMEVPEAGGKRFLNTAGYFSNDEMVDIIRDNFPEYANGLPSKDSKAGAYPEGGVYGYDNSQSIDVLGIKYRPFDECIKDTVKSLKEVGG